MTQVYKYRAEVGSNWKLFIDAFAEFYHAPVLHAKQAVAEESQQARRATASRRSPTSIDGPHGMVSSWGGMSPPKDLEHGEADRAGAAQRPVRSVGRARHRGLDDCPPALNPARPPAWGIDSFVFFPNFMLLVWAPGWYLTYHYWPTSYNTHIFEGTLLLRAAEERARAAAQELAAVTFKEYALQDGNTLEATQTMLESRAVTEFPLNDQEILLRHLHKTARELRGRLPARRARPSAISAAS